MNADSDAAAEIPQRWRLPADLHGAGKLRPCPVFAQHVIRHVEHVLLRRSLESPASRLRSPVHFSRGGKQLHSLHEINAPARLCTWPDLYVSAVANELHGPRLAH